MPNKNNKIKQSGENTNCIIHDTCLSESSCWKLIHKRAVKRMRIQVRKYGKSNSNSLPCTNQFHFTWHLKPYFDGAGKGKSYGRQTALAKCNLAKVCKRVLAIFVSGFSALYFLCRVSNIIVKVFLLYFLVHYAS